jgi:hypothetical protein
MVAPIKTSTLPAVFRDLKQRMEGSKPPSLDVLTQVEADEVRSAAARPDAFDIDKIVASLGPEKADAARFLAAHTQLEQLHSALSRGTSLPEVTATNVRSLGELYRIAEDDLKASRFRVTFSLDTLVRRLEEKSSDPALAQTGFRIRTEGLPADVVGEMARERVGAVAATRDVELAKQVGVAAGLKSEQLTPAAIEAAAAKYKDNLLGLVESQGRMGMTSDRFKQLKELWTGNHLSPEESVRAATVAFQSTYVPDSPGAYAGPSSMVPLENLPSEWRDKGLIRLDGANALDLFVRASADTYVGPGGGIGRKRAAEAAVKYLLSAPNGEDAAIEAYRYGLQKLSEPIDRRGDLPALSRGAYHAALKLIEQHVDNIETAMQARGVDMKQLAETKRKVVSLDEVQARAAADAEARSNVLLLPDSLSGKDLNDTPLVESLRHAHKHQLLPESVLVAAARAHLWVRGEEDPPVPLAELRDALEMPKLEKGTERPAFALAASGKAIDLRSVLGDAAELQSGLAKEIKSRVLDRMPAFTRYPPTETVEELGYEKPGGVFSGRNLDEVERTLQTIGEVIERAVANG